MPKLDADLAGLRIEPREPILEFCLLSGQPLALGTCLGKRTRCLAKSCFCGGQCFCGAGGCLAKLRLLMRTRARSGKLAAFFAEPTQHAVGLGDVLLLSSKVA